MFQHKQGLSTSFAKQHDCALLVYYEYEWAKLEYRVAADLWETEHMLILNGNAYALLAVLAVSVLLLVVLSARRMHDRYKKVAPFLEN